MPPRAKRAATLAKASSETAINTCEQRPGRSSYSTTSTPPMNRAAAEARSGVRLATATTGSPRSRNRRPSACATRPAPAIPIGSTNHQLTASHENGRSAGSRLGPHGICKRSAGGVGASPLTAAFQQEGDFRPAIIPDQWPAIALIRSIVSTMMRVLWSYTTATPST